MYTKYKIHITFEGTHVYVYIKGNFTYYLKRYMHVDTSLLYSQGNEALNNPERIYPLKEKPL